MLDLSKIVPTEIFTKSGENIYTLNIAYEGDEVLISNKKDKHSDNRNFSFLKVPNGKLCLWYSWPAGRN